VFVSALKPVFGIREYRRYAVLLLFAGMAGSVGSPLVPLYLRQELHATSARSASSPPGAWWERSPACRWDDCRTGCGRAPR